MSDKITILRHAHNLLAKTWRVDGTIKQYDEAKFFTFAEAEIRDLAHLSRMLTKLQDDPRRCVIRGKYVGDELAKFRDSEHQDGKVRRALDYFDDQPLHAVLLDVENFKPLMSDPMDDPLEAIAEFIIRQLPEAFHSAGYHWQLSNSAGHPTKLDGELRVHLWFWLSEPRTSSELKAWARAGAFAVDKAVFNPVQVHYTAAPVLEPGVDDPIIVRSGFVDGSVVELRIDEAVVAEAQVGVTASRGQHLRNVASEDAVVPLLTIRSACRDGFNIVCPFVDDHGSGEGAETSTQYYLPNTGGRTLSNFKCLHDGCVGRTRGQFLARLGVDEVMDEFEVQGQRPTTAPGTVANATVKVKVQRGIPEARHLTTDQANAGRIVNKFGKRLIVVAGQWYSWTGQRWAKDEAEVYRYACKLSKIIHAEADEWRARKTDDEEQMKLNLAVAEALKKWGVKSEMKATIEAAVGLAKKMMTVDEGQLDRDPWLLNCLNGTVDLRTGDIRPHDQTDYITKLTELDFDPTAEAPEWETVLSRVTCEEGAVVKPLARFLRRWFGYCATGSTREQKFVVHYGHGSNGKSTVLDTVADVLGGYAGTAAPGLMVSNAKDRHPTEIADLFGRRMMTAHETGEGGVLREDFIKQATGGDRIKARYMRADFFEFAPTHKLQLLTNHKPVIRGQDFGIWRRVLLVPYKARFTDTGEGTHCYIKDAHIAQRLQAERQGILRWVVDGAVEWYRDGLRAPEAVVSASKSYQEEQDRVLQFVNEACEIGEGFEVALTEEFGGLYPAYRGWCSDGGAMPLAKNRLVQELERAVPGFSKVVRKVRVSNERRRDTVVLGGLRLLQA